MWFFRHFFAPYLFHRSINNGRDKLRSKFWREKNVQKTTFKAAEMMLGSWNQQYLSIYVWLLYVIFSSNGIVTANCCFAVMENCPHFERFCNDFPFGTPEQGPLTYWIIRCVLLQSEHLIIKVSRERDWSLFLELALQFSHFLCFLKLR